MQTEYIIIIVDNLLRLLSFCFVRNGTHFDWAQTMRNLMYEITSADGRREQRIDSISTAFSAHAHTAAAK